MLTVLNIALVVGAGLIGGVFLAFSSFVMKALAGLAPAQGVAAMQRINVVVLNPLFLGLFTATALTACACVALAISWEGTRAMLLLAAGLCYAIGSFGVTAAFNVPRNQALARLEPSSPEAAAYWPIYVREWLLWNHVRTTACAACALCAAVALVG